ncbi:MAG: hypothetical protein B7X73_04385 [Methylophilales bacterium 39-45-7]|jgi:hypothetical protein|uniref:hypothetical protein n=1 Tax=Polynucleobacter sp. 35-46-11 TaxID=1970425 RepID=UPI000BCA1188|nr:hypothetical protein [Polynucleobacter sp. 35-46-11]OYY13687.1 MAG: hypothetical protein B7Y67_12020 [Polynucleobacter sp. 35-46-11]OZA53460.1 MAG: hypothetical protein B7X73_04385 [Methylophilales bacterium 39-45-7]HQS37571.1 hypothetical protein [Methylotenera sp.]
MFTLTLTLDSLSIYIVAADIVILLSYVLYLFHKKRELAKATQTITEFITDYFTHTGAEVRVSCYQLEGLRRFVTLIESQPLKRFRYSNVLENNLIAHIFQKTGNTVEKIYWRFPVVMHRDAMLEEAKAEVETDDAYFLDVQNATNGSPTYKVSEASWDEFKGST